MKPQNCSFVHRYFALRQQRRPGWLPLDARGESLLETLASITLIGILVIPFVTIVHSGEAWLATDTETEQALAYAQQGAAAVRSAALAAGPDNAPVVDPLALASVAGVQYAETITGPVTPGWDASKQLSSWTVTVAWNQNGGDSPHHVSLTVVVDPTASQSSQ